MASAYQNGRGQWIVQFPPPGGGPRATIHLGSKVNAAYAEEVGRRIDLLLEAHAAGRSPDLVTLQWLTTISSKLAQKLAKYDLTDGPRAATVAELCRHCVTHAHVEASTLVKYEDAEASAVAFFGGSKAIHRITSGDAQDFRVWLATNGRRPNGGPLAPTSVGKRLEQVKSFFQSAVRRRWLLTNPFDGQSSFEVEPPDRKFFVTVQIVDKLLEHATPEMSLLINLARYAGLRVPSEVWPLEWSWIDWEAGTLKIFSQKTKRFKKWRHCPLFPEVARALREAQPEGAKRSRLMFPDLQGITATAIRNRLERLCIKAGVLPWQKIWQNMRSTRETELMENYPIHVACGWIGNSPRVAIKSYGQITKDQILRACGGTCSASQRPGFDDPDALQNSKYA
jgi:integrase